MVKNRGSLDDTLAAMFSNQTYRANYLFYAHMIGMCSVKIDEKLPAPAGICFNIDHYDLYINPKMFDTFTLEGRLAILKHEMLHILYNHVSRAEDRVHLPWNIATDCAINQFIESNHLPTGCVTPELLQTQLGVKVPLKDTSENYYDLIKQNAPETGKCNSCEGSGQSHEDCPSCGGSGKKEDESSESGECDCEECGGTGKNPCEECGGTGQSGFKQIDDHGSWKKSSGDSDHQKDVTSKMIEKSQDITIKSRGTVPVECSEWLKIHNTKAELDWKKVLRGIVGNKKVGKRATIMRRDRRFPNREDLNGKVKDRAFDLLVIADVSGSMSNEAVLETLGEVRHICDITKTNVDLIQIDTQAYKPEKLSKNTKLITRKGNGGTTLHPALDKAKEAGIKFDALVVLTDGGLWNGDIEHFENLNKRVIWLIESTGDIIPAMNNGKMQAFKLKSKTKQD